MTNKNTLHIDSGRGFGTHGNADSVVGTRPWMSVDDVRVVMDGQPLDVQIGDLIFGNRLSWMQMVMNVSGDYLSHVGILDWQKGAWVVIEMGPKGVFVRELSQFVASYRFVAHARPAMHRMCRSSVVEAARNHLATQDLTYTYTACVALETCMLLRRILPESAEQRINALGRKIAVGMERHDPMNVTCSGFVYRCLRMACSHCAMPAAWPTRNSIPALRSAPSLRDVHRRNDRDPSGGRGVQTLVTPYDIWVAQAFEFRCVNEGDRTTLLYDLTTRSPAALPSSISMPIAS